MEGVGGWTGQIEWLGRWVEYRQRLHRVERIERVVGGQDRESGRWVGRQWAG